MATRSSMTEHISNLYIIKFWLPSSDVSMQGNLRKLVQSLEEKLESKMYQTLADGPNEQFKAN